MIPVSEVCSGTDCNKCNWILPTSEVCPGTDCNKCSWILPVSEVCSVTDCNKCSWMLPVSEVCSGTHCNKCSNWSVLRLCEELYARLVVPMTSRAHDVCRRWIYVSSADRQSRDAEEDLGQHHPGGGSGGGQVFPLPSGKFHPVACCELLSDSDWHCVGAGTFHWRIQPHFGSSYHSRSFYTLQMAAKNIQCKRIQNAPLI